MYKEPFFQKDIKELLFLGEKIHQSTKYYVSHVKICGKRRLGKSFYVCIKYLWESTQNSIVYGKGK